MLAEVVVVALRGYLLSIVLPTTENGKQQNMAPRTRHRTKAIYEHIIQLNTFAKLSNKWRRFLIFVYLMGSCILPRGRKMAQSVDSFEVEICTWPTAMLK